jgi:SNF2 family DNA or RNA helicase
MTRDVLETEYERRAAVAERIKLLPDINLPTLRYWNYAACEAHRAEGPQVDCRFRACGGDLFSHQRVAVAWLYAKRYGLLADDPGVGKTNSVLGLIALLKERNELIRRGVVIPTTPAVHQWGDEFRRWTPGIRVVVVDGTIPRKKRIEMYAKNFDVLVLGQHIAIKDKDLLERLGPFDLVVSDDVDPLLNHDNRTHQVINEISHGATRSFTLNATVLQVRLEQLHAALTPAGGHDVFGALTAFQARYVRTELVTVFEGGKKKKQRQMTGYQRIDELQNKVRPLYLRRKATELDDVRMPMLMPPQTVWLEMSAAQRLKYQEAQEGALTLIREEGEHVKHLNALTKFLYGQQICAGLPALGELDGPGASPKLDWLFQRLSTVWDDRKVIVFVKNVGMVRAAIQRAATQDIGMAMVWGQKQNANQRQEQVSKFWEDPNCRLMVGTTSIERSLNLQCANTVVALDTHLNPARMKQILGRAKRAGSAHDRVFMFTLLMQDTQEERYLRVLAERQAINDAVFEEDSEMYERLSPLELLQLMSP